MKNRARVLGMLLTLLAAGLWASSGIFVNGVVANSDISPINLAFLRELLTFLVLFGIVRVWKPKTIQVEKKDWI